jgi:hypothetical protein
MPSSYTALVGGPSIFRLVWLLALLVEFLPIRPVSSLIWVIFGSLSLAFGDFLAFSLFNVLRLSVYIVLYLAVFVKHLIGFVSE